MLYDEYRHEGDFRRMFVKDFLAKMGFTSILETHGPTEHGLDFVCAELHKVFGYRTYGVVVKHKDKLSQGTRDVDDVLRQVKQAFTHPVKSGTHGTVPREDRVSTVMVLNSGEITAGARVQIADDVTADRYGANVVVLSGEQLQSLLNYADADVIRHGREYLSGLLTVLDICLRMLRNCITDLEIPLSLPSLPPMPMQMIEGLFGHSKLVAAIGWKECVGAWEDLLHLNVRSSNVQMWVVHVKDEKVRPMILSQVRQADASVRQLIARIQEIQAQGVEEVLRKQGELILPAHVVVRQIT